ncbi:MAG: hypothetical protein B6U85_06110 [Desulfurococcales archaeon ex4484_42]|nr:MAG: hypothetical protein B6U85_06110 [Desulfurococcales archaeon ex4484_42]
MYNLKTLRIKERYKAPCHTLAVLLIKSLTNVLLKNKCDCIALSGGIDTSVIAALAKRVGMSLRAYTSIYVEGTPRDLPYVNYLEKVLGFKINYIWIDKEYIEDKIDIIRRCVRTNDYIELRNDLVFYSVLEKALNDKCKCIYIGSGGDEVFVGYSYMIYSLSKDLANLTVKYAANGHYPELILGKCLGIKVVAPYLSEEVLSIALRLPISCLRGVLMRGKELLRYILKSLGLDIIADRAKTPAEAGTGTDVIASL